MADPLMFNWCNLFKVIDVNFMAGPVMFIRCNLFNWCNVSKRNIDVYLFVPGPLIFS